MSEIKLEILDINEMLRLPVSLHRKRALRSDVEEFIIEEAEALALKTAIHLKVHLAMSESKHEKDIASAVHKHFCYRKAQSQKKYKRLSKYGWRILFIALSLLALIFSITEIIFWLMPDNRVILFFRESFIILGWVVLWRPLELLVYDLYPIKQKINLFQRLERCSVEVFINRSEITIDAN